MGHRLSKITTRTGDDGTTGLGDGSRVKKTCARIEAIGAVDELNSVIGMLLVHDVGEIDTGDTLVFIEEGEAERKAAERLAVERIFGLLPPTQAAPFIALWQEFEDGTSPEARFAHAADRAMPALLNLAQAGQSWVEHGITHERVVRRIGPPIEAGCPALWAWMREHLDDELARGWFGTLPTGDGSARRP